MQSTTFSRLMLLSLSLLATSTFAHQKENHQHANTEASARYLANESILFEYQNTKILFDPFFHNDYGTYQLVPKEVRQALMSNKAPYDNIDAVFISHAHEDHFDAQDLAKYLFLNQNTLLFAPQQAVDQIMPIVKEEVKPRLNAIALAFNDKPWQKSVENLRIEAVRIPHAGWPQRQDVENMVFRITLEERATMMHMGDADPLTSHYQPYQAFWQQTQTDINFPPYWFYGSSEGRTILTKLLNAKQHVGIHVPKQVPQPLLNSTLQYFSVPEEVKVIALSKQ
ncbi:MBL fold metallo-hydrolase [Thalassotalea ganghwensis]